MTQEFNPPESPGGLRDRRIAAGLSQEQLAQRAGVSNRTVSSVETGNHRALPLTLARIERALVCAESEGIR